jgi:transposase
VLACADGVANRVVAQRYRPTNATVGKWRQRFIDRRLDGIYDEPRVDAPRTISDEEVEAVIVRTWKRRRRTRRIGAPERWPRTRG